MNFSDGLDGIMKSFSEFGGFLTVSGGGKTNTMTISWGFIGYIWNKPHFITVVRPQRYTRAVLGGADSFTVSVPINKMKKELNICGTKSGRDIDKSGVVKFVPSKSVASPVIDGCDAYYECKIDYIDRLREDALPDFVKKNFYEGDYHDVFFGEIVECYTK